jgi:hypothetical protein
MLLCHLAGRAGSAAAQCNRGLARHLGIVERQRLVADDLIGLMTLAGDDQDIAGSERADRGADRLGAIADLPRVPAAGQDLRADTGSSLRGLSSVTMTSSASRSAISPICGRLPLSRSPPQPNTRDRR